MEIRAHAENNVDIACRHQNGFWNAVSSDQFGEQTAIHWQGGVKKHVTVCWFG